MSTPWSAGVLRHRIGPLRSSSVQPCTDSPMPVTSTGASSSRLLTHSRRSAMKGLGGIAVTLCLEAP